MVVIKWEHMKKLLLGKYDDNFSLKILTKASDEQLVIRCENTQSRKLGKI